MGVYSKLHVSEITGALAGGGRILANESGDAAANTATTATMAVGERFDGSIGFNGDHDWVRIQLEAGETYVFSLWGTDGRNNGVDDTILSLRNAGGGQVAFSDDVDRAEGNRFSQITYTPSTSGSFYLDASAWSSETGNYTIMAATNIYTVDQVVAQITEFGWGSTAPLRLDVSHGGLINVDITALTANGQQLARWALESWSNIMDISFNEVSSGANITFDDNQPHAFAGLTWDSNTGIIITAEVNISTGWLAQFGTTFDSYSYLTYVHEIGHALGLMHGGNYDGSATFSADAVYLNDSYQMTVMSYFDMTQNTFIEASNFLPAGPMIADIAAVHFLYGNGALPAAYNGNTVWGVNSNIGGTLGAIFAHIFDGATIDPELYAGGALGLTIYDSGGNDLIDLSSVSHNQNVDLNAGAVSDVMGLTGNLVIAQGTLIENLTTGLGNDSLIGNAANNRLDGGAGNDIIDGGAGIDRGVIHATLGGAALSDLGGGIFRISGGTNGQDNFSNIELFTFEDGTASLADLFGAGLGGTDGGTGTDTLNGGGGSDWINGLGGNDTLNGGAGDDFLNGGSGDDSIIGGAGDDIITGGTGSDNIHAWNGNDIIFGGAGDDAIFGNNGNDEATGGVGSDNVGGGGGNDILAGSDGNDIVSGAAGYDSLVGCRGNDILHGGDGNDLIGAGDGNDTAYGDGGNDFLGGGAGDDQLFGGTGNDTLNGGLGNDLLTGGANADEFVFRTITNGERDTITDFQNDADTIRIHGIDGSTDQAQFDALNFSTVTAGVEISVGGHVITVNGTFVSDFTANDFVFV